MDKNVKGIYVILCPEKADVRTYIGPSYRRQKAYG